MLAAQLDNGVINLLSVPRLLQPVWRFKLVTFMVGQVKMYVLHPLHLFVSPAFEC